MSFSPTYGIVWKQEHKGIDGTREERQQRLVETDAVREDDAVGNAEAVCKLPRMMVMHQ